VIRRHRRNQGPAAAAPDLAVADCAANWIFLNPYYPFWDIFDGASDAAAFDVPLLEFPYFVPVESVQNLLADKRVPNCTWCRHDLQ